MKTVFVDTSGFYAVLDRTDDFHEVATQAFTRAEEQRWQLVTTSFVVHESWALIQARLGWDAVDDFLDVLLPMCTVEHVDRTLFELGASRCRQARSRALSLTDCISFELTRRLGIEEAIAQDVHFVREKLRLP